jgi:hypothetical protein
MSHFGLEKFFKPKDGENVTIRILDEPKNKGWYWDHGVYVHDLPGSARPCTIGGPYDENIQPVKRYHLPVIHDGESKILAVNSATMKKIAEEGRRLVEEMQARLLVEWQREAAARFKRSKMFYGAKR